MEVLYMDEFVKSLDPALNYLTHEMHEHNIIIIVESNRNEIVCPYCGKTSLRIHSVYQRRFQDLPLQDKQVTILLNNKKYFCDNQDCSHRTFAERFDFVAPKSRKTNRLIENFETIYYGKFSVCITNTKIRYDYCKQEHHMQYA